MIFSNKFYSLIALLVVLGVSSMISAEITPRQSAPKDPGVINKEGILYWMVKRGELAVDASEEEKQIAFRNYIKGTETGGYRLPVYFAKERAALKKRLALLKAKNLLNKNQVQGAQAAQQAVNTTAKPLVILVDFPDLLHTRDGSATSGISMPYADYDVEHYIDVIFGNGYPGPFNETFISVNQYYDAESGGTFSIVGDGVVNWVTVMNDAAFYGGNSEDDNDINVRDLVKEAITMAVAGGLDLDPYDLKDPFDLNGNNDINEKDGYVDHVLIFHASIGEESGGGDIGEDAIWAHSWSIDPANAGGEIEGSDVKIFNYTIQPINATTGVIAHEFAHDIGLIDEYNTGGDEGAPVGAWSIMDTGSHTGTTFGTQPTGFSPLASNYFQQKYDGNWVDITTYTLDEIRLDPKLITLSEAINKDDITNPDLTNLIEVIIPNFFPPYSGGYQYYSGKGDEQSNNMSFSLTVPDGTSLELRMWIHWNIEEDWDYSRLLIKRDSDPEALAIAGNHTRATNPLEHLTSITNYLSGMSSDLPESTGDVGWVELIYDISEYKNETVTVTIEYITDAFEGGYGLAFDNIELIADGSSVAGTFDGAESTPGPTLTGFSRIQSTLDGYEDNRYWIQMRSFEGVDVGLSSIGYNRGMLVWLEDNNYTDNQVHLNPGHSLIGVIDAGQVIQQSGGTPLPALNQISDATFNLNGITTFDDSEDYTTPELPTAGRILPLHGLSISIQEQPNNSSFASLMFNVNQTVDIYILPVAGYTVAVNYLEASFTDTSTAGDGSYSYVWDFGDGNSSTDASPVHTYTADGSYTVELTVTDGMMNSDTFSSSVSVAASLPPEAAFTVAVNNLAATFTDTSSGGYGNLSYVWDFGNGTSSTEQSPSYTYPSAGTFTVQLTITDEMSDSDSVSLEITVTGLIIIPPNLGNIGGGGSTGFILLGLLLIAGRFRK